MPVVRSPYTALTMRSLCLLLLPVAFVLSLAGTCFYLHRSARRWTGDERAAALGVCLAIFACGVMKLVAPAGFFIESHGIPPVVNFTNMSPGMWADFICVGMYDFQIVEDANIALSVLDEKLDRQREWFA